MIGRYGLLAALVGLGTATAAFADQPPTPEFTAFATRADNHQAVIQILQAQWNQTVGSVCTSIKPVDWRVMIFQPLKLGGDGKPTAGNWKEIITSEGCGTRKTFNVGSSVNPDGTVKRIGLLPGDSHADVDLEREGLGPARSASVGIGLVPQGCEQTAVIDTKFITQEGDGIPTTVPGRDMRPWREEWTVKGCDVKAIVTMHFTPTTTGTDVKAAGSETKRG